MPEEDIDNQLREAFPKNMLTEEEFEVFKTMTRCDAIKYFKEKTGESIKTGAWYYDLYKNE